MQTLAGVCYFDLRPVTPADDTWSAAGAVAPRSLSVRGFRAPRLLMTGAGAARGSSREQEAGIASSPRRNACAWDGRLDKRDELIARLGGEAPRGAADGPLALAVYESGGPDALRELIGDWSLAIWDADAQTLLLASDYTGARPLYYCRCGGRLLWSSSLGHLAAWAEVGEISEEYVAEFLTRGMVEDYTPYRGIFAVPAGCLVRVSRSRTEVARFGDLPVDRVTRYRRDSDYEEHLRSLFREAVAVRLDTAAPVCAELKEVRRMPRYVLCAVASSGGREAQPARPDGGGPDHRTGHRDRRAGADPDGDRLARPGLRPH